MTTRESLSIEGLEPLPEDQLWLNYPPQVPGGYEDPEEERRYRKERVAGALRLFARLGYDEGLAGHISARDPEYPDLFWVNPFMIPFGHITASELVLVDEHGNVLKGKYPVAKAAFVIHSSVHKARPDAVAAVHCHSMYGKALSATDQIIEPLTQDACVFYGDHATFDGYAGLVDDLDEGKRLAAALGDCKAIILRNHGLLTVGESVDSAVFWYYAMEKAAQAQLIAKAAGGVTPISPEVAQLTYEQSGAELSGWLQFQTLFGQIVRDEPDLLD
ncbi:class II aldolase/adducin family protein [Streptomyces johnsoniae]|uniref:Class II aldolase/adducin family protein n=1 Tax=Streptomyces johnsoniae TaxID=3075532 RepID=A0ABU2S590_9ACTN|nr:class II aldolase/adducin family protein [Streptomyces sp. DSM 41886]MDT0444144.1 class II aldolase/adducin family protein [Streptomyces sp. DSM 41886]